MWVGTGLDVDFENRNLNFSHIISFWPPSRISGKATKVAYFLLKLKNRVLNIKIKTYWNFRLF